MEKIKQNAFVKKVGFNRIILILVMLLMYLAFGLLTGGKFFGTSRLMNTMNYACFLGFLSLGVTFVIATGGMISRLDQSCSAAHWCQDTASHPTAYQWEQHW